MSRTSGWTPPTRALAGDQPVCHPQHSPPITMIPAAICPMTCAVVASIMSEYSAPNFVGGGDAPSVRRAPAAQIHRYARTPRITDNARRTVACCTEMFAKRAGGRWPSPDRV